MHRAFGHEVADSPLRQLTITDLGHEEPTLLLTNQLTRSACHLIGRYAKRMLIENNIEHEIAFFHMDALSSAVAMKVNCDLQLALMASSLYRLLAVRVGNRYETTKSRQRLHQRLGGHYDHQGGGRGQIPEAGAQPPAGRRRVRQDANCGPLARWQAIEVHIWLDSSHGLGRAWCKVEN
ncbi:MAG TPA: hypothetical protein VJY33_14065 [Isosphaeraceae bacterium]|nr:hypothetical protein [Isosphaeraceae bacterium]